MVHGCIAGEPWDAQKPDLKATLHSDGIFGDNVWIIAANKPKGPLKGRYWCMVVPNSIATCAMKPSNVQQALNCYEISALNQGSSPLCQTATSTSFP